MFKGLLKLLPVIVHELAEILILKLKQRKEKPKKENE